MKKFIAGLSAICFVIINFGALFIALIVDSFKAPPRERVKGKMQEVATEIRAVAIEAKAWLYAWLAQLRTDSHLNIA